MGAVEVFTAGIKSVEKRTLVAWASKMYRTSLQGHDKEIPEPLKGHYVVITGS